jgi:hypothetical protein
VTTATVTAIVLAAALIPESLSAQPAADAPPAVAPRLEVGAVGGAGGTSPEFGGLVSVPLGDRLSLDVSASYLPRVWRAPAYALTQVQTRLPFKAHLRSRYSLLVGVTRLDPLDSREGDSPLWRGDPWPVNPHAGASLQWPILGRRADLRVDLQLVVQGGELIPIVPRMVGVIAWHAGDRTANRRRSPR